MRDVVLAAAYGEADRAVGNRQHRGHEICHRQRHKGLTALAVVSLIEDGTSSLSTTARSLLGGDLPLVDDAVTVEQLLAHRSGIGDYLDEDADVDINDYLMPVPVHNWCDTEDFVGGARRLSHEVPGLASGSPIATAATWCSP